MMWAEFCQAVGRFWQCLWISVHPCIVQCQRDWVHNGKWWLHSMMCLLCCQVVQSLFFRSTVLSCFGQVTSVSVYKCSGSGYMYVVGWCVCVSISCDVLCRLYDSCLSVTHCSFDGLRTLYLSVLCPVSVYSVLSYIAASTAYIVCQLSIRLLLLTCWQAL